MIRIIAGLAVLCLIGGCSSTPTPSPYDGQVCPLLSADELRAVLPASVSVSTIGIEGQDAKIRSCRWGPSVVMNFGASQDLIDATKDPVGSSFVMRDYTAPDISATGSRDSVLVVLYARTENATFSLNVSAFSGVTTDQLFTLAKSVAGRL